MPDVPVRQPVSTDLAGVLAIIVACILAAVLVGRRRGGRPRSGPALALALGLLLTAVGGCPHAYTGFLMRDDPDPIVARAAINGPIMTFVGLPGLVLSLVAAARYVASGRASGSSLPDLGEGGVGRGGKGARHVYGLGVIYPIGLGMLVLGGGLARGAMVGLLILPLWLVAIILISTAIGGLQAPPIDARRRLAGMSLLVIGMLGTLVLGFVSIFEPGWTRAQLGLVAGWVVWPAVVCAAVWLGRRPPRRTLGFLWLSLALTFALIAGVSHVLKPYLPESL